MGQGISGGVTGGLSHIRYWHNKSYQRWRFFSGVLWGEQGGVHCLTSVILFGRGYRRVSGGGRSWTRMFTIGRDSGSG